MIDLIRSLSQSEKRYFKLNLIHHSDNQKIIRLFDFIDRHKGDSESEIKKNLPKEFKKYYSAHKNALQEKLLTSLRAFHQKNNPRYEVNNLFTEIDILYNKKLIELCRKKIRRLRVLIEEHQLSTEFPKLIYLENLPGIKEGYLSLSELNEIENSQKSALLKLNEVTHHWFLPHRFVALRNAYRTSRSQNDKEQLDTFCEEQKNAELDAGELNVMSRVNLLNSQSLIAEYKNDHDLAWAHRREIGDLFMAYPKIMRANPSRFIDMFYNYMISCLKTEKFEEGLEACSRIESCDTEYGFKLTNHLKSRVFEYASTIRLVLLIKSGNFDSNDLVDRIEKEYPYYQQHLRPNSQLVLIYFIAFHFFVNEHYKRSLKWLNLIKDVKKHDDPEILTSANIFMMILHMEMDDRDYLENYFRNSLYFIKKKSRTLVVESVVMEMAKLFVSYKLDEEALRSMLDKLSIDKLTQMDKSLLYSFDLYAWITAKIKGTTFKEVLKNPSFA